jgi:D-3-phosphoglycerate dehydrogenase
VNAARGGLVDERRCSTRSRRATSPAPRWTSSPRNRRRRITRSALRDDVIATPHLGASSEEAQFQVAVDIAHQICEFLLEGVAHNAVNAPAVSAATLREIAPFTLLAEKIGAFLAQVPRSRSAASSSPSRRSRQEGHAPPAARAPLGRAAPPGPRRRA